MEFNYENALRSVLSCLEKNDRYAFIGLTRELWMLKQNLPELDKIKSRDLTEQTVRPALGEIDNLMVLFNGNNLVEPALAEIERKINDLFYDLPITQPVWQ